MSSKRIQYEQKYLQSAAAATGNGTAMVVDGFSDIVFQVTGIFVGTVTFECTLDGTNWESLMAYRSDTTAGAVTTTTTGLFYVAVRGLSRVRARVSAYTSGAITVIARSVAA